jgi:hypothetical protein
MAQARSIPRHAHRASVVVPSDEQHAKNRAAVIQDLHLQQDK